MSFLRNLWSDLVEKRLWPVALALLIALVAVPVLLGSTGSAAPIAAVTGATGATGALDPTHARAEVTLEPTVPIRRDRAGTVRDPFKQRKLPATVVTGATSVTAAAPTTATATAVQGAAAIKAITGIPASTPSTATSGSTGTPPADQGGTASTAPAPVPTTTSPTGTTPTPAPKDTPPVNAYTALVRFGLTDATHKAREVGRLSPLPSGDTPFLVFLGVLADKKTAVFLLSSDVTAAGDGTCRPRATSCETLELKAGDAELLEVTGDDGTTTTSYDLELVRVGKAAIASAGDVAVASSGHAVTAAQVRKAKASASSGEPGADDAARHYRFDGRTGLLHRLAASSRFEAFAPTRALTGVGFGESGAPGLIRTAPQAP